jgi:aquaporin Z
MMIETFKKNWKAYVMECICLGVFMISAGAFATLLEYPGSFVRQAIPNELARRCLMGAAMGLTAIMIIYSPIGRISGAHMNPALTLAFLRLGRIKGVDAFFYTIFQSVGGVVAVYLMAWLLGDPFTSMPIEYVVTVPGHGGTSIALAIEFLMSFSMMIMVLLTTGSKRYSGYTGIFAGLLIMCFIIVSAPLSGFSINPARTLASALPSGTFTSFWIYIISPFSGMFVAAVLYRSIGKHVPCAKISRCDGRECIFNCCHADAGPMEMRYGRDDL